MVRWSDAHVALLRAASESARLDLRTAPQSSHACRHLADAHSEDNSTKGTLVALV